MSGVQTICQFHSQDVEFCTCCRKLEVDMMLQSHKKQPFYSVANYARFCKNSSGGRFNSVPLVARKHSVWTLVLFVRTSVHIAHLLYTFYGIVTGHNFYTAVLPSAAVIGGHG